MSEALLAIVGTTASGKSALALEVARRLPGPPVELVSIDSMQVYRGMDIGTAKPSAAERAEVPHHLLDLVDPDDDFDLARFQAAASDAIESIRARGHRPLLVGGTGLYLQAVLDGLSMPGQFPEVKAQLDADHDTQALHERLRALDPVAAGRMEPTNRRRIVRALEVTLGSGRPFSSFGPGLDGARAALAPGTAIAGIWLPREVTAARIAARVAAMAAAGLVEEVERLRGRLGRTAAQALGYKELLAALEGRTTVADALEETVRRTRAFARRQRMWFRRDHRITWHATAENPLAVLPALLGDWSRCPT